MLIKGFRFGMLLQIAVGPICVFLFSTASKSGFLQAEIGVLAVTLVDLFYIAAAIVGIGKLLNKRQGLQKGFKKFGALVILLFGVNTFLSAFGYSIMPSFPSFSSGEHAAIFVQTLLLTLSNPLTILFWAGVLTSKMSEENFTQSQLKWFGLGAVCSTLVFLTVISFAGTLVNQFLPNVAMAILNGIVGIVLCYFAWKTAVS